MKRIVACLMVLAFVLIPRMAKADILPVSFIGSLASSAASVSLHLSGQSTCSVVLTGTWVGTVTFQSSSDNGATWVTATGLGTSGTATSNNTYTGNIATAGISAFRISLAYTSGTLNYAETCSSALGLGSGGGGGGTTTLQAWTYTDISASGNTVIKGSAGTLAGIQNLATTAQTVTITCFDNASTNSGNILISQILGAQQLVNLPAGGLAATAGITCNLSGAATTGIGVLWK